MPTTKHCRPFKGHQKDAAGSIQALTAAFQQTQQTAANAAAAFNQIATATQNGATNMGLYEEAYKKAQSAAQAAGTTFSSVYAQIQVGIDTVQKQAAAVDNLVQSWVGLTTQAGLNVPGAAIAANNALDSLNKTLGSLGISATQVGTGLQFAATGTGAAAAAAQPLIDKFNALYGNTENMVTVNGKLIPTIVALTSSTQDLVGIFEIAGDSIGNVAGEFNTAGISVIKFTDSANQATDATNTLTIAGNSAAGALSNVTDQMNAALQAALNTIDPLQQETDAFNALSTAADGAAQAVSAANSAGSGSGSGKQGIQTNMQDYASYLSNAIQYGGTVQDAGFFDFGASAFEGSTGSQMGGGSHVQTSAFTLFATGGIVTSPTLGIVGESGPEAVIPLPLLQGYDFAQSSSVRDLSQLADMVGPATFPDRQSPGSYSSSPVSNETLAIAANNNSAAAQQPGFAAANAVQNTVGTASSNVNLGLSSQDQQILINATNAFTNPLQFNVPGTQGTASQNINFLSPQDLNTLIQATNAYQNPLQFNVPGTGGTAQISATGTALAGAFQAALESSATIGRGGTGSGPVTVNVPITGNLIGSQQIANQMTQQIQANVVAALRQAGLKI